MGNFASDRIFIPAQYLKSVTEQPDRLLNAGDPLCLVLFMTERINFFVDSRQRTSRFSVRLSGYFPNPAPQNR